MRIGRWRSASTASGMEGARSMWPAGGQRGWRQATLQTSVNNGDGMTDGGWRTWARSTVNSRARRAREREQARGGRERSGCPIYRGEEGRGEGAGGEKTARRRLQSTINGGIITINGERKWGGGFWLLGNDARGQGRVHGCTWSGAVLGAMARGCGEGPGGVGRRKGGEEREGRPGWGLPVGERKGEGERAAGRLGLNGPE
jgi:hypothetical protein